MSEPVTVDDQDVEAVLEGHSFAWIQAIQAVFAVGMAILGAVVLRLFRIQSQEGWALMEDMPLILPLLTLGHALFALFVYRRDRKFAERHWKSEAIDPATLVKAGWRSAERKTPAELCVFLIEVASLARLAAYGGLALAGLFVLWVGIRTSDLLKHPVYWINFLPYLFWWFSWFRAFLTRGRALRMFRRDISAGANAVHVLPSSRPEALV
jgi:hypothetical protein